MQPGGSGLERMYWKCTFKGECVDVEEKQTVKFI